MTKVGARTAMVRFGDLFRIKHGFAFKGEFFSDESGDVVLTPGNFQDRGGLKFRPEKDRSYIGSYPAEFKLSADDLLVVMTDLTQEARILGAPAFVPPGIRCLHNQRLGKVVDLDSGRLDRKFLYYAMNGQDYREYLRATATGSTVKHTSPGRIYDFQLSLPAFDDQRRIVAVLSAYNDLIEVNRRRVAILEEMARRLFEEWFVHLRFPGHETVPVHDTPDGPLPEGWVAGVVGDLLTLHRGYDLATNDRSPGEVPVITGSGRNGTHGTFKIAAPGVVTGRSGTIGPVFLVHENFWPLNTALYVSSFTCVGPAFALFLLRKLDLRARAGGAAVPTLNRNHVHALPALRPPAAIVRDYERLAAPALELAWVLEQQSGRLAAARDHLLPRLVSGEISVADAPAPDRLLDAAD